MSPSAAPATQSGAASNRVMRCHAATKRVTTASPLPQVPRLPRKTTVDAAKCQACHVKRRRMSPTPRLPRKVARRHATSRRDHVRHQSQSSPISTTPATQNDGECRQVPRLPRKTTLDVGKRHPCHAKRRWTSPSATPATRNDGGCHQAPRLPRKAARLHAASRRDQARYQSQPSPIRTTPATQFDGGCRQAPHLPRQTTADVFKRHACHAKRRWMLPRAMPATQNDGGCAPATQSGAARGVTSRPSASPEPAQSQKYHACHAKRR